MILRVYDPQDCDEYGVPLDWECCRTCTPLIDVPLRAENGLKPGWRDPSCETCAGHGSLKAAALVQARKGQESEEFVRRWGDPDYHSMSQEVLLEHARRLEDVSAEARAKVLVRCEGCGHPMSEGTWEPQGVDAARLTRIAEYAARHEHDGLGALDVDSIGKHYSPCDEGCRHGGPGRWWDNDFGDWHARDKDLPERRGYALMQEASWRPVDVRTLGWPHDLRPEKLAVLCLRCWAERA